MGGRTWDGMCMEFETRMAPEGEEVRSGGSGSGRGRDPAVGGVACDCFAASNISRWFTLRSPTGKCEQDHKHNINIT